MVLTPGLRFCVAPRFHCAAGWAERLRLNDGMVRTPAGIQPRENWRSAAEAELRVLIGADEVASNGDALMQLLAIPAELRSRWWDLAERGEADGDSLPGYDALVEDLVEFLRFKGLAVPARCLAASVASRPGQRSTRLDAAGRALCGLGFGSLASTGGDAPAAVPIAVINLGDEAAQVVVLNLPATLLRERSTRNGLPTASMDALLAAFAAECPDYPLVCVRLVPGEGLWLPTPPPAFDGWTVGRTDLDAMLILHQV